MPHKLLKFTGGYLENQSYVTQMIEFKANSDLVSKKKTDHEENKALFCTKTKKPQI